MNVPRQSPLFKPAPVRGRLDRRGGFCVPLRAAPAAFCAFCVSLLLKPTGRDANLVRAMGARPQRHYLGSSMRDIRVATVQFQHAAGRQGVQSRARPALRARGAARGRRDHRVPGDVPHGLLARAQALARSVRGAGRAGPGWAVRAGAAAPVARARDDDRRGTHRARRTTGAVYNTYVVAMPDGTWAVHRKLHVFEHPYICAGDRYTVFDTPHGCRVGVLICYDNNIVENARVTALLGAEILLAPHQTGGCNSVSPHGDEAGRSRRSGSVGTKTRRRCEAELCGPKGRGWLMRWLPSRAHDNGMFLAVQQRRRPGRRRDPHRQRDGARPVR